MCIRDRPQRVAGDLFLFEPGQFVGVKTTLGSNQEGQTLGPGGDCFGCGGVERNRWHLRGEQLERGSQTGGLDQAGRPCASTLLAGGEGNPPQALQARFRNLARLAAGGTKKDNVGRAQFGNFLYQRFRAAKVGYRDQEPDRGDRVLRRRGQFFLQRKLGPSSVAADNRGAP